MPEEQKFRFAPQKSKFKKKKKNTAEKVFHWWRQYSRPGQKICLWGKLLVTAYIILKQPLYIVLLVYRNDFCPISYYGEIADCLCDWKLQIYMIHTALLLIGHHPAEM